MSKQKIAVLGGGTGSLSAVFGITDQPNWQDKYDITVYQLGWRLGGKGASGRQQNMGDRIEEHGLHIWFGFYENSFAILQKCYKELARSADSPLATWDEAFKKHNFIGVQEYHDKQWKDWLFNFPPNNKTPGQDEDCCWIVFGCIGKILGLGKTEFENGLSKSSLPKSLASTDIHKEVSQLLGKELVSEFKTVHQIDLQDIELKKGGIGLLLDTISTLLKLLGEDVNNHDPKLQNILRNLIDKLLDTIHFFEKSIDIFCDEIRRGLLLIELGIVTFRGFWAEGVFWNGFENVSDIDLRAWLKKYGASDTLAYSALTRAVYDLFFAFPNGNTGDQTPTIEGDISARAALHYMSRAICCYKGAIMWKMQAGMGDVVFTPLYQVLKNRGVKFKFFHKITDIIPNTDNSGIAEIKYNEQVTLISDTSEYKPLYDVKGLDCWPSLPLYDQIVQGEDLQADMINLESYWTPWQDVHQDLSLKFGTDFDMVICGISIAALEKVSSQLIAAKPIWQDMFDNIKTVQTQAMQLWLKPPLQDLGWEKGTVILDAYVEPFNTWADMVQTLPLENWSFELEPKDVAYFCGPMQDADVIPPSDDHNFPARENEKVKQTAISWINNNIYHLWPKFDWSMLIDPNEQQEQERFDAQYWRCNIDPTERYVMSVAGSEQYRLKPDGSGFDNLYLVGDWVNNGFINIGAIEPTVISGLLVSQAISDYPNKIICVS